MSSLADFLKNAVMAKLARIAYGPDGSVAGLANILGFNSVGLEFVVHKNNVPTSTTNTASANTPALDSFVLPAGAMGVNDSLEFDFHILCLGATSEAKTVRLWANSTQIAAYSFTTSNGNRQDKFIWSNDGAATPHQSYYNQSTVFGTTAAPIGDSGIDTRNAVTFYLTADCPSGSGIQKKAFRVKLIKAPV